MKNGAQVTGLEDAADYNAIGQHVKIVVIPLA
jgi:hypothetical protein